MATLDNLQDWLIAIAQHTRETREALDRAESGARQRAEREKAEEPGWASRLGRKLEGVATGLVASGVGSASALATRGFSGTVEAARLDYAMEQLGRQFAAVMKPVMDGMAYAAGQIEMRMRAMGGSEQNRMMGGILGAGVGMAAGRMLGAGMLPGAMIGLGMGPGLAGGGPGGQLDPYLSAGGGALAGWRAAGPWGAAAGGALGWLAGRGDYGAARARGAGEIRAGAAAVGAGAPELFDLAGGYNPLTAPAYWGARAMGLSSFGDMARSAMDLPRRDVSGGGVLAGAMGVARKVAGTDPRRDVTPFQAQMMEAGGTAMKIQEGIIRATAGTGFEEEAGPLKPIIDWLLKIHDLLAAILTNSGGTVPPPRSAGESRP